MGNNFDSILNVYKNLDKIFSNLPDTTPPGIVSKLKDSILNDAELKEIMDKIENRRPPKYLLIGNTGHGKSSLINAMLGTYKAKVSSVSAGTRENETFDVVGEDGKVVFSILDSRGINESTSHGPTAEKQLLNDMEHFSPDVAIFVHKAKERSSMKAELEFLSVIAKKYEEQSNKELRLPLIVVLTQCDELDPSSRKDPANYPQTKLENIEKAKGSASQLIREVNVDVKGLIVVSSLMEYMEPFEKLDEMTPEELKRLKFDDYRYQIEELKEMIVNNIPDVYAQMGALSGIKCKEVLVKLSKKIIHSFTVIAAAIALSPIPVSDVFILSTLEAILIMIIAALAGRELSFKAAGELAVSFGGIGAVGFGAKVTAQQLAKFFPGAGTVISSAIASTGIEIIGNATAKYYFK